MNQFYDAADWHNIPPQSHACLYVDGKYAVPANAAEVLGLAAARYITVTGNYRAAGCADWHPDNNFDLRAWALGRYGMAKRYRIYVSRDRAREALNTLGYIPGLSWVDQNMMLHEAEWWIPTLDGVLLSAAELAAQLAASFDAPIPAERLWAQQWTQIPRLGPDAKADQSVLFGEW